MNTFLTSGVLLSVTCIILAGILIRFGYNHVHKIWLFFNLIVAIWGIGCILISLSSTESLARSAWLVAIIGGYLIPTTFYHTVNIFTKNKSFHLVIIFYLYSIFSIFINFLYLGKPSYSVIQWKFDSIFYVISVSASLHIQLIIWFLIVILGHIELFRYYVNSTGEEKNKTAYFFTGMFVGFIGGGMNLLPIFGIDIYPYGNFTIPLYCSIVTYAILKHRLTNINIVFRKGIIYSFLITIIAIIYSLSVVLSERIFQGIIKYDSIIGSLVAAAIIAIIFTPLKNYFSNLIDRSFFNGTQLQIAKENQLLRQEIVRTDKLKSIATLASGLAHEVRNPLTAIKTFCEFLPRKMEDKPFLLRFSRIVNYEIDRIDRLVAQLLDFAKPTPLSIKETNINQLVDDTLNFLNSQFIQQNIKVIKNFPASQARSIRARIDPNQLKQALLNIFLNAIDAMPKNGQLTIDICKSPTEEGSFEIIIADTGCGIAPGDLPHIFDPFYTKKDGGTGLGLAITHQIITEHQGTMTVESKLSVGTLFRIKLPHNNS